MLGDINPQSVRIAQQAVVYPGRNHVNALTIKRYDGRRFEPVNLTDITRVVLAFPSTDPTVVFDSTTDTVFSWTGNTLTVDLSDYAMPASILPSYLIVFDAEHPQGQVLVDDIDARLEFDFRLIPVTGTLPPPAAEFITDAPQDGDTYGRKDGTWVPLAALVSGVSSVNGQTGVVVLDAADVGAATAAQGALADSAVQPSDLADVATSGAYADLTGRPNIPATPGDIGAATAAQGALADSAVQPEDLADVATSGAYADLTGKPSLGTASGADATAFDPAGAADAAISGHVFASDPHPQYQTQTESDARYERGLTAGANISIDRTNPNAPVINASGGGTGEVNTASSVGAGVSLYKEKVGVDLRFKTLVAGTHIGLVEGPDTVTINASGGGGSSAVDSVNGQTGDVVLDAADVGADPAGTAASAVSAHATAADPHPQYLTQAEGDSAYAPQSHVGATGGAHGTATTAAAGFMSAADKNKLNGVAAGATANSSDATLLDRENHTGTQAANTISDFNSASRAQTEAMLVAGTNVTLTPGSSGATRTLTINAAGGGGGAPLPVVQALTSSRTLALADANTFNVNSTTNAYTQTIPAQATVAWAADTEIHFLRSGAGAITLTAAAGVSINGTVAGSVTMNVQHGAATLKRVGVDAWWLGGLVASAAEQRAVLAVRERLTADRTYFVRTDGNDSNNGLTNTAGGAFLTIQRAIDVAASLDLGIFNCTIQIADGTYTGAVVLRAAVGAGQIRIIGNETTPANVTITGGGNLVSGVDFGRYLLAGVTIASTGPRNIQASGRAQLQYRNIISQGAAGLNTHVLAINYAEVQAVGPITINGNSQIGFSAASLGFMNIRGQSITFAPGTTIASRGFQGGDQGRVDMINMTFNGSFTGPRYQAIGLGAIFTNGAGETYIPGTTAGTVSFGGIYY